MTDKIEIPKIYNALITAQKQIGAIGKDEKNTGQGFKFRGIDTVYNEVHRIFSENEIFCTSEILNERSEDRESRNGGCLIYRVLQIRYTFVASDGSSVSTEVMGEGMDSGDKASNKAMAVAHKYALLQMFTIPTKEDKDPDGQSPILGPKKEIVPPKNNNEPTDKQRKMIWAISKKAWPGTDTATKLKLFCEEQNFPSSSKEWTKKQASKIIELINVLKEGGDIDEY